MQESSSSLRIIPDVLSIQERLMARKVQRAGLESMRFSLGDDSVHAWVSRHMHRPPVLLLHGFGADALWGWAPQLEALAQRYTVIAPDLLWFGESRSARDDHSLAHQTEAVLALLDHLDVPEIHGLVGLSYGGLVAWALAAEHAERVRRTAIIASPGPVYQRSDLESLLTRFSVDAIEELLLPRDPRHVRRLMRLAYARPPWVPPFVRRRIIATFCDACRREKTALVNELVDDMEALIDDQTTPPGPVQIIWGENDRVFPLYIAQRLRAHLGSSTRLDVVPNARHAPNLEYPNIFNSVLRNFLRTR